MTIRYASNSGSGTAYTTGSPGNVVGALAASVAGDAVILKGGTSASPVTYTGDNYMLHPPAGRSGTNGNPITVMAETDGGVVFDGQVAREPVLWNNNSWWVAKGFNACNSIDDVMCIFPGSSNNIFQRICAWNANPNKNSHVWSLWQAPNNLVEDTAAFGNGRKMYETFELSGCIIRRPFACWNNQILDSGPYITYSLSYNSDHVIIENPIGTRDEDNGGANGISDRGIFSMDRMNEYSDCQIGSGYYGGFAFLLNTQTMGTLINDDGAGGLIHGGQVFGDIAFQDVLLYVTPGSHGTIRRVLMAQYNINPGDTAGCSLTSPTNTRKIFNVAQIGNNDGTHPNIIDLSSPNNGWTETNYHEVNSVAALYPGGSETLYVGTAGPKLRYQYQNGVLTNIPLWPWPMNQRIKDAMTFAGRTPIDVQATVEGLFGVSPDINPAGIPPVDNFDSYTVGATVDTGLNGGTGTWTSTYIADGGGGSMTIQTAPAGGQGGKCIRSTGNGGAGTYSYRTFQGVATNIFLWGMYTTTSNPNDATYGVSYYEAGVGPRCRVHFASNGNIEAYNYLTAAWVTVSSYSTNTWYPMWLEIDAIGHANQYRVSSNGGTTWTAWLGANGTLTVLNLINAENFTTNSQTLYIDAIGVPFMTTSTVTTMKLIPLFI